MDDSASDKSQGLRHRIGVNYRQRGFTKLYRNSSSLEGVTLEVIYLFQVAVHPKQILSKQAKKIAKQAEEHERFISKVTHFLGVLGFGTFCFLLGSRPQDIPYIYCCLFFVIAPLRWIYCRFTKMHYYLLDFCYYANSIFMIMILFFPRHEKLFMICFSFSEGPLAWAIIVWRCSLVFSSFDKIFSVLIHLLPGIVFFVIRWWSPVNVQKKTGYGPAWPTVNDEVSLWTWLFFVPLIAYAIWQALYSLIVDCLRHQRLLRDPEVMTSFRELSKKAQKANNIWWRLSGLLGDQNRVVMYSVLQAAFTIATMALTVPIFKSYIMHVAFEILKVSAAIWNGGNYIFDVMPRKVISKEKKKIESQPLSQDKMPCATEIHRGDSANGNVNSLNSTSEKKPCVTENGD